MLLWIPEMDPRLVAHLDLDAEVGEPPLQAGDHFILGPPGSIGIEIEEIVVGDTIIDRAVCTRHPDTTHASCNARSNSSSAILSLTGLRSASARNLSRSIGNP